MRVWEFIHPACFTIPVHIPALNKTLPICSPRTSTKMNCPKTKNKHIVGPDCFQPSNIAEIEVALPTDKIDYVPEDGSSSTLHSNKLEVPEPRAFKEPSFRCCNNIIVLSHNVPYEQQQMICPTCHTIWQVLGVQDSKAIVKETGKAPRTPRRDGDDDDGNFDPNGGGCPPPPGAGCG